jgi:nicotinamidase-related amidase
MAGKIFQRPLMANAVHLCVDMQRIFAPEGPWPTPWMEKVLPVVSEIAGRFPARTVFTRFITPERPEQMPGTWRAYYEKWREATRERLDPRLLELVPPLSSFVPPAKVIDKMRYSAFAGSALHTHLRERGADTLIVTGSETDVCVLATVLDAVDFGYRVILVRDAVCSSSDAGHDAMLEVYHRRYSLQIETADAQDVLRHWPG